MRFSQLFFSTFKEVPKDAEVLSHQLMLRAGMIRKVAAGIYSMMPLGLRVLRKFEAIVREEMNRSGAQEVLMPSMIPSELWKRSSRWDHYGRELLRIKDRHGKEFCYGPTHEEVITELANHYIKSYKQLPINAYQIQTKFRDEIRPRFGLMRGREFLMKDAYSFHASWESLDQTYRDMAATYRRIFQRAGLKFKAVKADSGAIGGDHSSEFMVTADTGEDAIMECLSCDYAANLEAAESHHKGQEMGDIETKTWVYMADQKPISVILKSEDTINEIKLRKALNAQVLYLSETTPETGLDAIVDLRLSGLGYEKLADLRNVKSGDICPHCHQGRLQEIRGIEVGHIFQLGDKYSHSMTATYVDEAGQDKPFLMGCYGIGIGRSIAASIEQNNDKNGIIWPVALAPYLVDIIATSTADETLNTCAESLYGELLGENIEVILDDRDESAGLKFKDADLIGIPFHVIVGKKFLSEGLIEFKSRQSGAVTMLKPEAVLGHIQTLLRAAKD